MNQGNKTFSVIALAIAILAVNLFVLSPRLVGTLGLQTGTLIYIFIRVLVIGGVAFVMTRRFGRRRYQAIAAASFVAFVDHAVLKAFLSPQEFLADPGRIGFGLLMSYVASFPIIMIIAFLGSEAGRIRGAIPDPKARSL